MQNYQILYRLCLRMENRLKLFLPLSLKELGLRKVSLLFSSNSDVLNFFYQSLDSRLSTCEIKEWLETTEEKMSKLGLPESLNKQVVDCIQDIGFEMRKWKEETGRVWLGLEAEDKLPDVSKLCWTSTGAINRKMAEHYLLCVRLNNWRRYEIACLNCMENLIPLLWNELSEREKKRYEMHRRVSYLECLWPYILEGEQSKLDYLWRGSGQNLTSLNQWAFERSARNDNQVAAEYFFQKLTPEEREGSLMRTAYGLTHRNILADKNVLFYLLSVMTPEQQIEIVKARPIHMLFCFLDWPRRHLLPENARLIWTFLQESDYGNVLTEIAYTPRRRRHCFPKLFQEFFKHAPLDFIKKSFVGHESDSLPPACRVLCQLVNDEDSGSIEVMFGHADAASRVKLVFHDEVFGYFFFYVLEDKWHVVEACLREAALSEEDKDALQECFMRFLDQRVSGTCEKRKFRRFFEFLHETGASDDKEKKLKRRKLE